MQRAEAALKSLEDSLDRLAVRLRGSPREAEQLLRARLAVDAMQADIAKARIDGAIGPGWGEGCVDPLNRASMAVAVAPREGDDPFQRAMDAVTDALDCLTAALTAARIV